jgi:class 3 adenylate cyclase
VASAVGSARRGCPQGGRSLPWPAREVHGRRDPGDVRCPTRALRCAFALTDALGDVGLEIRSAIHTGEIEIRDEDVGGIGVHIAARALTQAADRDVVVTRTVRDLATGTDLAFGSLGSVSLRGVPGEWELFNVSVG